MTTRKDQSQLNRKVQQTKSLQADLERMRREDAELEQIHTTLNASVKQALKDDCVLKELSKRKAALRKEPTLQELYQQLNDLKTRIKRAEADAGLAQVCQDHQERKEAIVQEVANNPARETQAKRQRELEEVIRQRPLPPSELQEQLNRLNAEIVAETAANPPATANNGQTNMFDVMDRKELEDLRRENAELRRRLDALEALVNNGTAAPARQDRPALATV